MSRVKGVIFRIHAIPQLANVPELLLLELQLLLQLPLLDLILQLLLRRGRLLLEFLLQLLPQELLLHLLLLLQQLLLELLLSGGRRHRGRQHECDHKGHVLDHGHASCDWPLNVSWPGARRNRYLDRCGSSGCQ